MFGNAGSLIVQLVALVLYGFLNEAQKADDFECDHSEVIPRIQGLLMRYERLERDGFIFEDACQEWLLEVVDIFPELYD